MRPVYAKVFRGQIEGWAIVDIGLDGSRRDVCRGLVDSDTCDQVMAELNGFVDRNLLPAATKVEKSGDRLNVTVEIYINK